MIVIYKPLNANHPAFSPPKSFLAIILVTNVLALFLFKCKPPAYEPPIRTSHVKLRNLSISVSQAPNTCLPRT